MIPKSESGRVCFGEEGSHLDFGDVREIWRRNL